VIMQSKPPERRSKVGIKAIVNYLLIDYYCRTYINFIIASLLCGLFFVFFMIRGREPDLFIVPVAFFGLLCSAFFFLLIARLLKVVVVMRNGTYVEAVIDRVVILGTTYYEIGKAIEIISELENRGDLSCIRVKMVEFHYSINGKKYTRIYHLYRQKYKDVSSIITTNTWVVVDIKRPCGTFVLPGLLGFSLSI